MDCNRHHNLNNINRSMTLLITLRLVYRFNIVSLSGAGRIHALYDVIPFTLDKNVKFGMCHKTFMQS